MTTHALAHRPSRRSGIHTQAGTHIPAADVHAQRTAREAERWLALATERTRMRPDTLTAKAFGACAFSVQKQASSLAVPSKLTGTSRHQPKLRTLAGDGARWAALDLDAVEDGLVARHNGAPLGRVQSKHLGWVRPLVPFGLTVYLSRVTGTGGRHGYRLGVQRRLRPRRPRPFADWPKGSARQAAMVLNTSLPAPARFGSWSPVRPGPSAFLFGPSTRR